VGISAPWAHHDDGLAYRLLCLLRDDGATSRAELVRRAEEPRGQVLAAVGSLVRAGLVRDAGPAPSRGGRRSSLVELAPDLRVAAVDIGLTSIDVEIADGRLAPVAAHAEPADVRAGPAAVLRRVNTILAGMRAEGAFSRLQAVALGLPVPVCVREGTALAPPALSGWHRYPVGRVVGRAHGCPVVVDNGINLMAIGEHRRGAARTMDDVLFVKMGTGIGGAIIANGAIYRGTTGCAGDIGHIQVEGHRQACACGNLGCLEAVFSGAALARDGLLAARGGASRALAEELARHGSVTARAVAAGAAAGDPVCIRLVRDGGRLVGTVLADLVSFANPSIVVIGGGLVGLGHALLAEIRAALYRRSRPWATGRLPVVVSELGDRVGLVGGALLATEVVYRGRRRVEPPARSLRTFVKEVES
jgi:predicted NBD/HSP70 family sugar kinase